MLKSFVLLLMFLGTFLIMNGIYDQKYKNMKKLVRTEYRFVPRTLYDEVLANTEPSSIYKNYFDSNDPWYNRNVGIDIE